MKKKLMKTAAVVLAVSLVTGAWAASGGTTLAETAGTESSEVVDTIEETNTERVITSVQNEDGDEVADKVDSGNSSEFNGGSGTEEDPYEVATAEQLDAVRNNLDAYYIQVADIDLSGYEWEPIGSMKYNDKVEENPFTGTYDGNGYEIENMSITSFDLDNISIGLFGVNEGTLMNINLVNCFIDVDCYYDIDEFFSIYIGAVAGRSPNRSAETLRNCSVTGTVSIENIYYGYVGGIVGYGPANECKNYAEVDVTGLPKGRSSGGFYSAIYCGGISGLPAAVNREISECVNYADITVFGYGYVYCGGISGEYGAISDCINYGNITGTVNDYSGTSSSFAGNCNVGGIVGATSSDTNDKCINYGNVYAYIESDTTCYAGGIAGYIGFFSSGKISNCYNMSESVYSDRVAGRIAGYLVSSRASDLYSYDGTLVNGAIPTEDIGTNLKNGSSLSWDEINEAIEPILSVLGIDPDENGEESLTFVIPNDEWSFKNYGVDIIPLTNDDYDALMYACGDNEAAKKAFNSYIGLNLPWYQYLWTKIKNGYINGGQCYGMALSALLVKNDLLSLSSIQDNISMLYEAEKNENSKSVIGWYQLSQYLVRGDIIKEFEQLSTEKQLNNIADMNSCFILGYGAENWGEHAVVGYDIEKGSWNYHGKTYNTRVLTYDSNTVYNSSNIEDYYFYFNYGTDEWEVPHYGVSSEKSGYLVLAYETVDELNMDIEKWREEFQEYKATLTTSNSNISLETEEESFMISGGKYSEEEYYAYYEMGYNESSDNYSPKTIVEFDDIYSFTISSGEDDVLDYGLLFDDYYFQVLSESFETVYFSDTGEILITGLENEVGIALTANNDILPWDTVSILNDDSSVVSMEQTNDGILVYSDNLGNVTVYAINDEENKELTFSTDEDSVLISESNNELIILIDADNDGVYETDINDSTGHEHVYAAPEFTWSDDYASCTAEFTCEDGDYSREVECVVTFEDNGDGTVTYTATAEFNGDSYEDTRTAGQTGETPEYPSGSDDDTSGEGSANDGTSSSDDATSEDSGDDGSSSVTPDDDADTENPADEGDSSSDDAVGEGSTDDENSSGSGDDVNGEEPGDEGSSAVTPGDDTGSGSSGEDDNTADVPTDNDSGDGTADGGSSSTTDDGASVSSGDTADDGSSQESGKDEDGQASEDSSSTSSGDSAQTGDNSNVVIWFMLLVAGGAATVFGASRKKKRY